MKGVCPLLQISPHVPPHSATTAASPRATSLLALAENQHYCVSNPREPPVASTRKRLKLSAVVLALDSPLQCKEEDCVPLPVSQLGLDTGRESRFPSFEAAWVFVFPAAMPSGACWSSKLTRVKLGQLGAGHFPGEGRGGGGELGMLLSCHSMTSRMTQDLLGKAEFI